jgi:tetratricopeptide (TPR) repeat protein
MQARPFEEGSSGVTFGPSLAWVLADLASSRATGMLRVTRPRGPAVVHFRAGRVTRIEADDMEPLMDSLIKKGDLLASQARAAMSEIEHLDVTLAQTLVRQGLMSRKRLDEIRAERTRDALETLIASGSRMKVFEAGTADPGPVVEVVAPTVKGLIRSGADATWLSVPGNLSLTISRTEKYWKLRQHVAAVIDESRLPAAGECVNDVARRGSRDDLGTIAALVLAGLLEVIENKTETPADIERRVAGLDATEEACRLLIRASEMYEKAGDYPNARRAALSALRRKPTFLDPLIRVEQICIAAREFATLELVYELVNGAMPGPFGRRALLYRAGSHFEHAFGDIERAREYYGRAVSQVPESGAALDALLRTSTALEDMRPVIDAYAAVGLESKRETTREAWLQRAVDMALSGGHTAIAQNLLDQIEQGLQRDSGQPPVPTEPAQPSEDEAPRADEPLLAEEPEADASSSDAGLEPLAEPDDTSAPADDLDREVSVAIDAVTRSTPVPTPPVEVSRSPSNTPPPNALGAPPARSYRAVSSHPPPPETVELCPPVEVEHPPAPEELRSDLPMTILADPHEEVRLRQLCATFMESPEDVQHLFVLREAVAATSDDLARTGVSSFLALFSRDQPSRPIGDSASLGAFPTEVIRDLADIPRTPEIQALATLWKATPQLVAKDLAELGVGRALPPIPGRVTPAQSVFTTTRRLISSEVSRLFHVPAGPAVAAVLTNPPSVLIGPAGKADTPEIRFRVARAVAMGHPEVLVPCLIGLNDLQNLLMALQAAFGDHPPRGSLDFAAASLAQDLWSAVSPAAQQSLREFLKVGATPEVEGIRTHAHHSASLMALLATGDAAAALRVCVADDPFLAGTDPTTEDGFVRAIRKSSEMAALVRLALSPEYWELRLAS